MRLAMLCLPFLASAVAQEHDPQLIGRWRSLNNGTGGIGAMYEFRPNGAIEFSPGAILAMEYRLEGARLVLLGSPSVGPDQHATVEWTRAGNLRMTIAGQATEEYRREGPAPDSAQPLLGEWVGSRMMDQRRLTTRWIFTAPSGDSAGQALFLMPFTTQQGRYLVKAGGMSAAFSNGTLQGRYTIKNDILTLTRSGDRVQRFARY